ncbi:MAG: glycoside hydrolase family 3 N-terminal domain-containing protein [bacterium]
MDDSLNPIAFPSLFDVNDTDDVWVDNVISKLSLKEKIAQMIMPYAFANDPVTDSTNMKRLEKLVSEYKVGGILFLTGDIISQVKITNKLQELSDIPLLISADYERGLGMRLSEAVIFPYNMAFGAAGDPNLSYLAGKATAIEGRALGVHINFAPVLDVNHEYKNPIINIRSYSSDPNLIAWQANSYIKGINDGGMISTGKHFPGHGATSIDSHSDLPIILESRQMFDNVDLIPFKAAIKSGVRAIMIGHLEIPALESTTGLPATFSRKITTKLLQEDLKFSGLVITDAMNMLSIQKYYSSEEAGKLAVLAGNDIILFPVNAYSTIEGIYNAVVSGEIPEARIDHSVRKILSAKKGLHLDKRKYIDTLEVKTILNQKSHWRLSKEIAEKSITLLKDEKKLLPIDPGDYYSTAVIVLSDSKTEKDYPFQKHVENNFNYVKSTVLNLVSKDEEYESALELVKKSKLVLLPAYVNVKDFSGSVEINEKHLEFIKEVVALDKSTVVISFGNPYIITEFPEVGTYLCAYGEAFVSQRAMLDALLGRNKISGTLPISIPGTEFDVGYGIRIDSNGLNFGSSSIDSNYVFNKVDELMNRAVKDSVFPAGELLIGRRGKVIYNKAFGRHTYEKNSKETETTDIFDLASLTKVISTASLAMLLYDEGKLNLDQKVISYLPGFDNHDKDKITIRNLLLHDSGLPSWMPFYTTCDNAEEVTEKIMNCELKYATGTDFLYSDIGMIVLQKVIEKIAGESIDKFFDKRIVKPLGMKRTMFNPPAKFGYNILPTEKDNYWRKTLMKGNVHDEIAYLLDGVSGNAGLFGTAEDIAKLLFVLLNEGRFNGKQFFKKSTVELFTTRQSSISSRALGWDTKSKGFSSAGNKFSENSFGHTGFTGTSIWIDKEKELFVILLTNRVYPTRENKKIIDFRPVLHDVVVDAVSYDF